MMSAAITRGVVDERSARDEKGSTALCAPAITDGPSSHRGDIRTVNAAEIYRDPRRTARKKNATHTTHIQAHARTHALARTNTDSVYLFARDVCLGHTHVRNRKPRRPRHPARHFGGCGARSSAPHHLGRPTLWAATPPTASRRRRGSPPGHPLRAPTGRPSRRPPVAPPRVPPPGAAYPARASPPPPPLRPNLASASKAAWHCDGSFCISGGWQTTASARASSATTIVPTPTATHAPREVPTPAAGVAAVGGRRTLAPPAAAVAARASAALIDAVAAAAAEPARATQAGQATHPPRAQWSAVF